MNRINRVNSGIIDNQLNLVLDVPENVRERTLT